MLWPAVITRNRDIFQTVLLSDARKEHTTDKQRAPIRFSFSNANKTPLNYTYGEEALVKIGFQSDTVRETRLDKIIYFSYSSNTRLENNGRLPLKTKTRYSKCVITLKIIHYFTDSGFI